MDTRLIFLDYGKVSIEGHFSKLRAFCYTQLTVRRFATTNSNDQIPNPKHNLFVIWCLRFEIYRREAADGSVSWGNPDKLRGGRIKKISKS